MGKITTALFDFDGVVADTEPIYDQFWSEMGLKYHPEIPGFAAKIKGTTMQYILDTYFPDYTEEERRKIEQDCSEFEQQMDFPEVSGAIGFIHNLKQKGFRVGLVTSSPASKMKFALQKMGLTTTFDTLVTADRIKKGKPDPQCYLLAAEDLGSVPQECVVFEDSLPGIQAGTSAGMMVIGLSTTLPSETIRPLVTKVIPDFQGTIAEILG